VLVLVLVLVLVIVPVLATDQAQTCATPSHHGIVGHGRSQSQQRRRSWFSATGSNREGGIRAARTAVMRPNCTISFAVPCALSVTALACAGTPPENANLVDEQAGLHASDRTCPDPPPQVPHEPPKPPAESCTPPPANPLGITFPSWIRIAYSYTDPPFDVCFPLVATLNAPPDYTGAKPAIGGAGISTGMTTPYIAVPSNTNQMRFVAAGASDCSSAIGVRLSDTIGPLAAQAGSYYTFRVDKSGYFFSWVNSDEPPTLCKP
jgi:hypothetical protein